MVPDKPDRNINGTWELHGYSDADYAGDNDTQKSVTVYIVLIMEQSFIGINEVRKQLNYLL